MNIWSPWKKVPIMLPAQSQEAQAVGYTWALYKHADIFLNEILEQTPTPTITQQRLLNYDLARIFCSTHPEERRIQGQEEQAVTKGAAFTFIMCPYIQTNDPGMFQDLYAKGFAKGYRFCYFACAQGLLELLYVLPDPYWWPLLIRFAWERMAPETAPLLGTADIPLDDRALQEALDTLGVFYLLFCQEGNEERRHFDLHRWKWRLSLLKRLSDHLM